MTTAITPAQTTDLAAIARAGQVANAYAAAGAFSDYRSRKSDNTRRAHSVDLAAWAAYMAAAAGASWKASDYAELPNAWAGVTWGLVEGFTRWALRRGYSIASINRALSTVRTYAQLAAKSGAVSDADLRLIRTVRGYGRAEGKRVDERRETARRGAKKAQHVALTPAQVESLKAQPDTPQGRRDALLMALLLDHGLRVGEVALLTVGAFNLSENVFRFFRPKVDKVQTHELTEDTRRALQAYIAAGDAPAFNDAPILRGSRKGGTLQAAGMSERAITARVGRLGAAVGVQGLSAHDCRHSWATRAAWGETDAFALRDAGGWNSLAMPSRYVESAAIANRGVKLIRRTT